MKYLKLLSFLACLFSFLNVSATTFIPMSYEEQIKNSDAVVHATFKGKAYKKLDEGNIVTVNSFVLEGSSGISHSALINKNDFKIISPGGVWNGRTYLTNGSPSFKEGEEVVLFLKKSNTGYRVMNLSLGKYSIEEEAGVKYLRNSVFPVHPRMKRIKLEKLQERLTFLGKSEIKLLDQRKSYSTKSKTQAEFKRQPASYREAENNKEGESDSFSLYALFAMLAGGGLLFKYVSKKFT
jgi:hypothetical protein